MDTHTPSDKNMDTAQTDEYYKNIAKDVREQNSSNVEDNQRLLSIVKKHVKDKLDNFNTTDKNLEFYLIQQQPKVYYVVILNEGIRYKMGIAALEEVRCWPEIAPKRLRDYINRRNQGHGVDGI